MMLDAISILVVDDNRQMRMLVRSVLRGFGFTRLYEAVDPAEALEIMRVTPIDLLITDVAMKPIDGLEFARMVRRAPDSPNSFVSIVVMSGHSGRRMVAEARDAGVNSYLVKPVTAQNLYQHIMAAAGDARPFVRAKNYFGPDRRTGLARRYNGPLRRSSDGVGSNFDLDDVG